MKNYFALLVSLLLLQSFSAKAQIYERRSVQSGQSLSAYNYYLFPSFSNATVKLKNSGNLAYKMNFNMLVCQMQFIGSHDDTLNLLQPDQVDSIYLNNSVFFYDRDNDGYIQIYPGNVPLRLAVLRKVTYEPVKMGALRAGFASYSEPLGSSGPKDVGMDDNIDVVKETIYYIVGSKNEMTVASKSNFLKLFEMNKKEVELFIKRNKINLDKDYDLQKLLTFCLNF